MPKMVIPSHFELIYEFEPQKLITAQVVQLEGDVFIISYIRNNELYVFAMPRGGVAKCLTQQRIPDDEWLNIKTTFTLHLDCLENPDESE